MVYLKLLTGYNTVNRWYVPLPVWWKYNIQLCTEVGSAEFSHLHAGNTEDGEDYHLKSSTHLVEDLLLK